MLGSLDYLCTVSPQQFSSIFAKISFCAKNALNLCTYAYFSYFLRSVHVTSDTISTSVQCSAHRKQTGTRHDETFFCGKCNAKEGGPKGIEILPEHQIAVIASVCQPLAVFGVWTFSGLQRMRSIKVLPMSAAKTQRWKSLPCSEELHAVLGC